MTAGVHKVGGMVILSLLFGLTSALPAADGSVLKKGTTENAIYSEENAAELGDFFEGDMELDEDQMEAITQGRRNGLVNEKYRWPGNTVWYQIDPVFDINRRNYILKAFTQIESVTCVKFSARKADTKAYVYISGRNTGCHSGVGFRNSKQRLNLQTRGCFGLGTIIHEILHTLGFYHQQSSYNRDDYVQIFSENIQSDREGNFKLVPKSIASDFGVPYDYGSIMHYGSKAFSKNGEPTILPKNKKVTIGQRKGLSKSDVEKINLMYKCKDLKTGSPN